MKLQSLYKTMDTVKRTKQQPKIFTNPTSDRKLLSNIYKELKKLHSRELKNPIKNGVQSYTETFQQRNIEWLRSTQQNSQHH